MLNCKNRDGKYNICQAIPVKMKAGLGHFFASLKINTGNHIDLVDMFS
jgi:hypothetical protein